MCHVPHSACHPSRMGNLPNNSSSSGHGCIVSFIVVIIIISIIGHCESNNADTYSSTSSHSYGNYNYTTTSEPAKSYSSSSSLSSSPSYSYSSSSSSPYLPSSSKSYPSNNYSYSNSSKSYSYNPPKQSPPIILCFRQIFFGFLFRCICFIDNQILSRTLPVKLIVFDLQGGQLCLAD